MFELSRDESSIVGDPGRRRAAAQEARGARTFTVTSAPAATLILVNDDESQFLRLGRLQPSEPFVEKLKPGTE